MIQITERIEIIQPQMSCYIHLANTLGKKRDGIHETMDGMSDKFDVLMRERLGYVDDEICYLITNPTDTPIDLNIRQYRRNYNSPFRSVR